MHTHRCLAGHANAPATGQRLQKRRHRFRAWAELSCPKALTSPEGSKIKHTLPTRLAILVLRNDTPRAVPLFYYAAERVVQIIDIFLEWTLKRS